MCHYKSEDFDKLKNLISDTYIREGMRSEQEIFNDLVTLCSSKGFIHAIAGICFIDNVIKFNNELKAEDMAQMFSRSCLLRTETTTLIGLMMRVPIDFTLPSPQTLNSYIEYSKLLLNELHQVMIHDCMEITSERISTNSEINPLMSGTCFREMIFYSGESAYSFQYRDLALRKYSADAQRSVTVASSPSLFQPSDYYMCSALIECFRTSKSSDQKTKF